MTPAAKSKMNELVAPLMKFVRHLDADEIGDFQRDFEKLFSTGYKTAKEEQSELVKEMVQALEHYEHHLHGRSAREALAKYRASKKGS